ncbi:MAG: hypothetical protein ACE5IR_27835, partial [bacterium]
MKFDIGTILSISHGRLLTEISNVYKILNYLLDDNLFTHQIPRAGRFTRNFVIAQHSQLSKWDELDKQVNRENGKNYVKKAEMLFGKELEIEPMPDGVWTYKDAIEEAQET